MKKRLFFLIVLAFLLCGCTAEVNITIKDNTVSERISIAEAPYDIFTINDVAQQYRKYIPAFSTEMIVDTMPDVKTDGIEYYRSSGTAMNGVYHAYYQYDYVFKEYKKATSINNAFKSSVVQFDSYEKEILLTTESSGMTLFSSYPQLDEVKINIAVDYPVKETNADYVNGNIYTWIFTKDTKKGVYLLLEDLTGKSVGGIDNNTKKPEEKKENPEEKKEEKPENKSSGENKGNEVKKEDKNAIEKGYEKFKEEGKKHPHIIAIIFIALFLIVVLVSFRIKKV